MRPRGLYGVSAVLLAQRAGSSGSRLLSFTVAQGPRDTSRVTVSAEAVWIVPKPSADLIPATAKALELTVARPAGGPEHAVETLLSITVTEGAKIAAIVDAINEMPLEQPGQTACPDFGGGGAVATFTFLAGTAGPVVATAKMPAYTRSESVCYGLTLTLPALTRTVALDGGEIVGLAETVLGVSVYTPEEQPPR